MSLQLIVQLLIAAKRLELAPTAVTSRLSEMALQKVHMCRGYKLDGTVTTTREGLLLRRRSMIFKERGKKNTKSSHRVRLYRDRLPALGRRRRKRVPKVVEPNVEGPPTIHILLELRCLARLIVEIDSIRGKREGHTDGVSASVTCATCTTPLERVPLDKNSASSTWSVVSNSSTRSSFAVDQGH